MKHPLEREYHDNEWGVPVHDDIKLFEVKNSVVPVRPYGTTLGRGGRLGRKEGVLELEGLAGLAGEGTAEGW